MTPYAPPATPSSALPVTSPVTSADTSPAASLASPQAGSLPPSPAARAAAPAPRQLEYHVLGDRLVTLLSSQDTRGELSLFLMENGPEAGVPRHVHDRESEAFHVLEGAYEVELGGRTRRLTPGMSAFLPKGQPHAWRVADGRPAKTLVLTTPGGFEHMFADLTALAFHGPFTPEDVAATAARHGVHMLPSADDRAAGRAPVAYAVAPRTTAPAATPAPAAARRDLAHD